MAPCRFARNNNSELETMPKSQAPTMSIPVVSVMCVVPLLRSCDRCVPILLRRSVPTPVQRDDA